MNQRIVKKLLVMTIPTLISCCVTDTKAKGVAWRQEAVDFMNNCKLNQNFNNNVFGKVDKYVDENIKKKYEIVKTVRNISDISDDEKWALNAINKEVKDENAPFRTNQRATSSGLPKMTAIPWATGLIQCLVNIPELAQYCFTHNSDNENLETFYDFVKKMWGLEPSKYKDKNINQLKGNFFESVAKYKLGEFLNYNSDQFLNDFINSTQEFLSPEIQNTQKINNNDSSSGDINQAMNKYLKSNPRELVNNRITKLFKGVMCIKNTCRNCYRGSYYPQAFDRLNFDLSKVIKMWGRKLYNNKVEVKLEDCIKEYCQPKSIGTIECSICKKYNAPATTQTVFFKLPRVLMLSAYAPDEINLSIPEKMDLASYEATNDGNKLNYNLTSILNTENGCYVAYIKSANGQWYKYKDEQIYKIGSYNQVLEDINKYSKSKYSTPYLIIYRQ